jgi:hypothetical protein
MAKGHSHRSVGQRPRCRFVSHRLANGHIHPTLLDAVLKRVKLTVMPKFTIKDWLLGSTLVAIGLAMVVTGYHYAPPHDVKRAGTQAYLLGAGGIMIGSGLAYPFGKRGGTPFLLMCGIIAMLIVIFVFNSMNSLP